MTDCGLILGTNALVSLGFMVYHANGATIQPERIENRESNNSEVLRITFEQRLCLRSYQTKTVKVRVGEDEEHCTSQTVPTGILTPCEFILARGGCDFLERFMCCVCCAIRGTLRRTTCLFLTYDQQWGS